MFKEDYIMRIIHEVVRTLLKLLFGIDEEKTEEVVFADAKLQDVYQKIRQLAAEGRINEGENLLWEQLEAGDGNLEQFQMAVLFYDFLNTFSDEELERADYSREEISQGLLAAARKYGYEGMVSALLS